MKIDTSNPASFIGRHRIAIINLSIIILLFGWFFLFAAEKIDLTTADLGRHIKNGEVILSSLHSPEQLRAILNTNFYSYTNPDYPFINHHWGSGVIFYLIYKYSGFQALSLFYLLLEFAAFLFVFDLTRKIAGTQIATILSLLVIPLVASRAEIRPEVFSYFFTAVFFWILWCFSQNKISGKWLIALPLLIVLWINLHIYFFLGLALIGLFLFEQIIVFWKEKKIDKLRALGLTLFFSVCFSAINPFGIKELIYPLKIFDKYGYLLVENQSVWFLQKLHFDSPDFVWFKILLILLFVSLLPFILTGYRKLNPIYLLLAGGVALMACLAIRNFPIFALLILPIVGYNISVLFGKINFRLEIITTTFAVALIAIAGLIIYWPKLSSLDKAGAFGIGVAPDNNRAAEFIKENDIKGPIFNNYDIGGFLVFNLFPDEKIFVDNRPEAYPVEFFQQVYIPMQQDAAVWRQQDEKYGFNAVVFGWRDATPWGQGFIAEKVKDAGWAPIFVDNYILILLKRNAENEKIIEKYEISRENFQVINNG